MVIVSKQRISQDSITAPEDKVSSTASVVRCPSCKSFLSVWNKVDATIKRMEKAVYDLEELRKEQVDTGAPHGSFGLGVALGAGLWFPQTRVAVVPEVFDTDKVFRVQEGGLAPL